MKLVVSALIVILTLSACASLPKENAGEPLYLASGEACPADSLEQRIPSSAYFAGDFGCRSRQDWARIREIRREYDNCVQQATAKPASGLADPARSCAYRRTYL